MGRLKIMKESKNKALILSTTLQDSFILWEYIVCMHY